MPTLAETVYRLSLIRHSLGLPEIGEMSRSRSSSRMPKPYRNHFAEDPNSTNWEDLQALVAEGAMVRGRDDSATGGLVYFHVTEAGAKLVGVNLEDIPI